MNILFLTSHQEPIDGWSVVGYNIIKNIDNSQIDIFSSEEKKIFLFGKSRLKSELFKSYGYLSLFIDLINILLFVKIKPDLIYCNVEYYAPVAMWLSNIYKIPYTVTAHGTYGVMLPTKYKIYKKSFERANKVITVSRFTRDKMAESIKANYIIIPNGVDKSKFKPDAVKKEHIITFVGNLKPRKGLNFLLESMIEVNKIQPDIKLIIIGNIDFNSRHYLETLQYIKANNLNVTFSGKISERELILYYQKAKLNILPSKTEGFYFEGFGLIHAESIACGTPSIGTLNSGNEEAISKNNGYLVEYGNTRELCDRILEIFGEENQMPMDIEHIADWTDVAKKYQSVFENII